MVIGLGRFLHYLLFPYLGDREKMREYFATHSIAAAVILPTWLVMIPAVIVCFLGNIWSQMLLLGMYIGAIAYAYIVLRREDLELAQQTEASAEHEADDASE